MLYNQPYGISDPNAAYINGDPSIGRMGSIPPAASIEHPQREIVNFLADSALTPSSSNLRQLSESVQNGKVNFCTDSGAVNFMVVSPTPPITTYKLGQYFRIKSASANTLNLQVNISGVGWSDVVHSDGSPMRGGEVVVGQIIEIAYDGTKWQMMTGAAGTSGLVILTAPRSLYVDNGIGSDTLYDGTAPTIDVPTHTHGPFKTLRRALAETSKYNLGGWLFNIYMADATYTDAAVINCPIPNGSGSIFIHGNVGSPNNVKLFNNGVGSAISVTGGFYQWEGVSFQATAASGSDAGNGIWAGGAGRVWLYAVNFYACPGAHILAYGAGTVAISGPIGINGNAAEHMQAGLNGVIDMYTAPYPNVTINNAVTFSAAFVSAYGGGQVVAVYTTITGAGNVTGSRYAASSNGVISTGGRGASYLPGTSAGTTATGGQYT